MLRIDSINTKSYNPSYKAAQSSKPIEQSKKNSSKLLFSLGGLATAGLVMVGLKKTSKMSYQEALKKAGVEIKNNIATKIENGEKFTGKIERFEKRNRKETVVFVDGVIQEKLYHNALGKELSGIFYKDGEKVLQIWRSVGQVPNSQGFAYSGKGIPNMKPNYMVETKEGFAWARNYVKEHYNK